MRTSTLLAAALTLALASLAPAQQAMSEYSTLGMNIFCARDLAELDKAAKLTPAQKESIESLMRDAMNRVRPIWMHLSEDWQARGEEIQDLAYLHPEQYAEAYKKYSNDYWKASLSVNKQTTAVEREALGDIRAVLTADQNEHAWPAFERARRRILLCNGEYFNLGHAPRTYVEKASLAPADRAIAEELLARYETDLDPLLRERMEGLSKGLKQAEEKGEPDQTIWARQDLASDKIYKLNVRTAQSIAKALSEDGRSAFLRQRVGIELKDYYFRRPSADERITAIRKLPSLTPEQKTSADQLIVTADTAMFEFALNYLRECDEAALREKEEDPTKQQEQMQRQQIRLNECSRKGQTKIAALIKSLRALITTTQLDELDYGSVAPGGDPFKMERERTEDSEWSKPFKDTTKPEPKSGTNRH